MPNSIQQADLLFKKYLGKGSSGTSSFYFNEPLNGRTAVFPTQIWQEQSLIPLSASYVAGIVEQVLTQSLIQVPGQAAAYYHPSLRDAVPFNYDSSGSYVPLVYKSDMSPIAFGENDWVIDIEAGMLTFYNGIPTGVSDTQTPKVTFWKYTGEKGMPTGSLTASYALFALTASYAMNGGASVNTASFVVTASGALTNETASYAYTSSVAVGVAFVSPPTSPSDPGVQGQMAVTNDYFFIYWNGLWSRQTRNTVW
jgi:hypothetical protein